MIDMSLTVAAKSDQLTADSLLGRTLTIRITRVSGCDDEQPIAIHFEGDEGKPYKPCKIMRRVIIQVWDRYADAYVGKSMTLYRDPKVRFGAMVVGGIRISHMSGITEPVTLAVMESKKVMKPFTVKPLVAAKPKPEQSAAPAQSQGDREAAFVAKVQANLDKALDEDTVHAICGNKNVMALLANGMDGTKQALNDMVKAALARVSVGDALNDGGFGADTSAPVEAEI